MAMGIDYNEFWNLNPRKLTVIIEGYKLKRQVHDEEQWILGGYISYATTIAIGNAFRKKGQKEKTYFEVLDKPFLKNAPKELSEAEKQKKLDMLMASLRVMQSNFELNHKK